MPLRNSPQTYGALAIALHWLSFVAVAIAWLLGQLVDAFPKGSPREAAVAVHVGFGLSVLLLTAARIAWRRADPPPGPEPNPIQRWSEPAARIVHGLLYLLLLVTPTLGISVRFAGGHAISLFGLARIPSPLAADRALAHTLLGIHDTAASVLVAVVAAHVAAALFHHVVFRDRTLLRMLPERLRRR